MSFRPALSLTEQIADHLGAEIISGRLQPSERIQELKVAKDLGVSRGSVREALLILEGRHLIEIYPRRGAVVSGLLPKQVANYVSLASQLVVTLWQKLARQHKKAPVDFSQVEAVMEEMQQAQEADDLVAFIEARVNLARVVFPIVDDYYLEAVIVSLMPAGQRLCFLAGQSADYDLRDTLRNTRALLDAVKAGDEERIEELVRASWQREARFAKPA